MSTTGQTMELLGKKYPFKFGMKFQRLFMQAFEIEKLSDFEAKIKLMNHMDTLESLDVLAMTIICAINCCEKKPTKFDVDDVIEDLVNNREKLQDLIKAYVKAQPNPVGKSNKAKTK